MSPTEADLRAALRDGAGDEPNVDPDGIISAGRAMRSRRRNVALSSAAAVVVVAGIAVGASALVGGSGSNPPAGSAAAMGADGNAGAHAGGGRVSAHSGSGAAQSATVGAPVGLPAKGTASSCPRIAPRQAAPGGIVRGSGGSEPMFRRPVASFVACLYSTAVPTAGSSSMTISGALARTLAASISHAATQPRPMHCPRIESTGQRALVLYPTARDGSRLPALTATLTIPACDTMITNRTAVRYDWVIPGGVATKLNLVTAAPVRGGPDMPVDLRPSHGGSTPVSH